MKAEEIRDNAKKIAEVCKGLPPEHHLVVALPLLMSHALTMMAEGAAQLAEANESLKYIAHPLVEVQSPEQAAGEKTLRDEFAMAAMQGLMAANLKDCPYPAGYVEEAYKFADGMLEARKK